jgi:hypothetical protein
MSDLQLHPVSLERMVRAVEKVRDRLHRATSALAAAKIPYAVVDGNAVAAWVARVDEAAVRNTQDVDILVRRTDFDAVRTAMEGAGFIYRHVNSVDMFLDGPGSKDRDAVHILMAGEKVREDDAAPAPDVTDVDDSGEFLIVDLKSLVRMKLIAFRDKDRTHLRDMIEIGLIDESWTARFAPPLAERLQSLLDTPDG